MSQIVLLKYAFRPGGKELWLRWCKEMGARKDEFAAALKAEGVLSESCFLSSDGEAVFYLVEAQDLEQARSAGTTSENPIDFTHFKNKRACLEQVASMECLFHVDGRGSLPASLLSSS